jgi:hypothetical protein
MTGLPGPLRDALLTVRHRLGTRVDWLVGGSVAAALWGVEFVPRDIDVFTDRDGAYEAARLLGGDRDGVRFSSTGVVRSHFGSLRLGEVTVEIMGGFQTCRPGGGWRPAVDVTAERVWIVFDRTSLPIAPPGLLARIYRDLGRADRAEALAGASTAARAGPQPLNRMGGSL